MIKRPLLLLACGFVLGEGMILSGRAVWEGMLAAAVAASLVFVAEKPWTPRKGPGMEAGPAPGSAVCHGMGRKRPVTVFVVALLVLMGVLRAWREVRQCEAELAYGLDGQTVTLEGEISGVSEKNGWLILELARVSAEGKSLRSVQVYLDAVRFDGADVRIGNGVTVAGECSAFDSARNPGEFDYRLYYRSMKMSYRVFGDSFRVTDFHVRWYREGLRRLAEHAAGILGQIASPEDAGMLCAVILGDRTALPEEVRSLYQRNGIAHMLAVSGLHLSLVSLAAYEMVRKLGAGYGSAAWIGSVLLVSYAILTGFGASVVRALIMAMCGFLAAYLGRTYDLLSALGLSALVIAWDSPYSLCQSGVQLSFSALIGIGGLAPCLKAVWDDGEENGDTDSREARKRWEAPAQAFRISVSMQLATMPLILYHFFQAPPYSMFLNLLVVPFAGILVGSGVAGIVAGSVCLAGGRFAVGGACLVLRWFEWCCRMFERLPGSVMIVGRPAVWQIGAYYGAVAAVVWSGMQMRQETRNHKRRQRRMRHLAAMLVLSVVLLLPFPVSGLEVTFLDVGQGDGICLRTGRYVVLSDGGSTDQKNLGELRLVPFLKSEGIRTVDYAIVSHGDQDHISGLSYLLEEETGISVRHLVLPAAGYGDASYEGLCALAEERGCTVVWLERGDQLCLGKLTMTCLYPDETAEHPLPAGADRNEHSLVLRVDYGEFHMMLTGDMSAEGEAELLELSEADATLPGLSDIQVLKVAHHGSRYSTSDVWLDALAPSWAVISCGEQNRYGHPHEEAVERLQAHGVTIYPTPHCGAVILKTNGKNIRWRTWV